MLTKQASEGNKIAQTDTVRATLQADLTDFAYGRVW